MKEIKIQGFTTDLSPNCKPAICCYGEANTGTTRFGTTVPCDNGAIGWIAIDRNSKVTAEEQQQARQLPILVNKEPLITTQDSMKLALLESQDEAKKIYTEAVKRLFDMTMKLAGSPDIESIVIDRASQVFDMILFSHFGRRNQIESFQRGAPNQDMIDFITALNSKNLALLCKAAEIWKDTGEVDKQGRKKQAPTGKFRPDGFNKIDQFVTATIELTSSQKRASSLDDKYKCKIVRCKGNVLLEGVELTEEGICGEAICWDNVMQVIKNGHE